MSTDINVLYKHNIKPLLSDHHDDDDDDDELPDEAERHFNT